VPYLGAVLKTALLPFTGAGFHGKVPCMTSKQSAAPAALTADAQAAKLAEYRRAAAAVRLVEHSKRVKRAESKLAALRQEQTKLLVAGRGAGMSWDDLGAAAGVTRQAVQQRVNSV
jgi:hypothetical protein